MTQESGYWVSEQGARDTLSALRYYRQRGDVWEQAYLDLKTETEALVERFEARVKAVEDALNNERAAWALAVAKAEAKSKAPGFGFFAGYGVTPNDGGEFVIGAGLVWKIW